ncbi:MAG: type IV pilus biogenesis/stability protein PilW [Betaproteobacteria bacterium]
MIFTPNGRRWFRASASVLAWVMAGFTAVPVAASGPTALSADIRTASDQGQAERRAWVRLELASAYFARGQVTTALDEVKQALALYPQLAEGLNLRALIYASLGQDDRAQDSFDRALALAPQDGSIWHNQGWFWCQRAQYGPAQEAFGKALAQALYTGQAKTRLAQGVCLAQAGREEQAIDVLRGAFASDPGQPALAVNLAHLLARRGHFEEAAAYIRHVNRDPAWLSAQTLWLDARVEHGLGDDRAAQALLQRLRQQFPQAPQAWAAERGAFDE